MASDKLDSIFLGLPKAFVQLPDAARSALASRATVRSFKKNETVVAFGQSGPSVVALRSGLMAVTHSTGEDSLVSDFICANDVFAESTESNKVAAGQLTALASSTAVLFPVDAFREAMLAHAPFAVWMLNRVENRCTQQYFHRLKKALLSDEACFAYFLWWLADPVDNDRRLLRFKLPERVIASYLGVGREQVNRKKQLLEKTGYIRQTAAGLELSPSLVTLFSLEASVPLPDEQPFYAAFTND